MSLKRRILKWGAIGLLVLLFAAWFGFTTFFFNPLEDDYEYDVSTLVPRNVDFFAAKAGLAEDLNADLSLRISDELDESARVAALREIPAVQELLSAIDLTEVRTEVQNALANVPVEVDPVALFGGRDLALAGYFPEQPGGEIRWAVYGRTNWMGKLGVALLGYPGLIDLEGQGMTVEDAEDPDGQESERVAYLVQGGQLTQPLFVHRVQDVVILGNDVSMFAQVPSLVRQRGQDSFGQSARYQDRINKIDRGGDEVELFLDYRTMAEARGYSGRWPDINSDTFAPAFLGQLFQSGSVNDLIGTLSFGRVSGLELHANLSSEVLTSAQKRLYRQRGLDRDTILTEMAALVPEDAGVFLCGVGGIEDLLRAAKKSAEDALVTNLEDVVRQVWSYADSEPLIDDFDAMFGDRFAFCMVDNDWPRKATDPGDGAVVPAWGLVLWVEDEARVIELRDKITGNQSAFGIHGLEPGTQGVYTRSVAGGNTGYEYFNALIPGTGHMASISANAGGRSILVIGNHLNLCGEMIQCATVGAASGFPSLAEYPTFRTQLGAGLGASSFVLWLNPKAMDKTWRGMSDRWAADKVSIDWGVERPRIEKKVIKDKMPDATWGSLTPDQESQLEMLVQPELDAFEREFRSQHKAKFKREIEGRIDAAEGFDAVLLQIGLDKADIDVSLRVKYPIGE